MNPNSTVAGFVGRATIQSCFRLTGRGTVLVFEAELVGNIPHDGTVIVDGLAYPYRGPEYLDGTDGSSLGIIVSDTGFTADVAVGGEVSFQ